MNAAAKLVAFAVGLAGVFVAALGVGAAVGPVAGSAPADATAHVSAHHDERDSGGDVGGSTADSRDRHDEHEAAPEAPASGGLGISESGYTLVPPRRSLPAGTATPISFGITDADGHAVTDYDTVHDKRLHLIAVRRDLSGFQHVHPELDRQGQWTTDLSLQPGSWRVFADFTPSALGENLTLGADVSVAGDYRPQPIPPPSTSAQVGDYTVTLDGTLTPGEESELTLSVSRHGDPVTDLEPYLAAYGHLVALRAGDLAYLHVHPAGEPGDGQTPSGPGVTFFATAPSAGDYRLFLDFKHRGVVRTAEFTVRASVQGHHR